jgi:hypothetical protein
MNVTVNAVIAAHRNYQSLVQALYKETELNGAELSGLLPQVLFLTALQAHRKLGDSFHHCKKKKLVKTLCSAKCALFSSKVNKYF